MKPFSTKQNFNAAFYWLAQNAKGDCCILVKTDIGTFVYGHQHSAPLFRSLYGPMATT